MKTRLRSGNIIALAEPLLLGPVYLSWLIFVRDKSVLIAARGGQLSHSK